MHLFILQVVGVRVLEMLAIAPQNSPPLKTDRLFFLPFQYLTLFTFRMEMQGK
jgi:hypothetical protein